MNRLLRRIARHRFRRNAASLVSAFALLGVVAGLAALVAIAPFGASSQSSLKAMQERRIDSLSSILSSLPAARRKDSTTVNLLNALSSEYRSRDADSSLHYALAALKISEERGYSSGLCASLVNLGNIYRNLGDYSRSLEFLRRALLLAEEKKNDDLASQAHNGIGIVYIRQGNFDRALEELFKSLRIAERLGNKRAVASALDNIGIVHIRQGNPDRAFRSLFRALALTDSVRDKRLLAIVLNDIAIAYRTVEQFDSALIYYERSLRYKEELEDKQGSALTLNGIGIVFRLQGKYDDALSFLQRALELHRELEFQPGVATVLSDIAQTQFKKKNYKAAIRAAEECIAVARGVGAKAELKNAYQTLSDIHEAQGNVNLSFVYFRLFVSMKDSLFNEEIAKKTADLNAKYEQEAQIQRIKLLERERQVQDLELQRASIIVYALSIGGILVAAFIGVLWSRIRYRRRAEAELNKKNIELAKAHEESEKLLKNTLPAPIVARLKRGETIIADRFESVTVLFADIVGFSTIASELSPEELIALLDSIFSDFDAVATKYNLEKIKTVGDSYMLVGGAPETLEHHCLEVVKAAFDLQRSIAFTAKAMALTVNLRIGIHTGSVVAGIIGAKKYAYDLWGDTVNIASRMELHGKAGEIHCTEEVRAAILQSLAELSTKNLAAIQPKPYFVRRDPINVKGKGVMQTYFIRQQGE